MEGDADMVSGGQRVRNGPTADINSYRQRRNADGWIKLPERVERRRTPNWPLKPAPNDRERELWRALWRQGQSIIWESQHQGHALAIYVRLLASIEAVEFDVPASRLTQMRIMAEDLGITLSGMLRHKWRFATHEELQEKATDALATPARERKSTAAQIAELFPDADHDEEA